MTEGKQEKSFKDSCAFHEGDKYTVSAMTLVSEGQLKLIFSSRKRSCLEVAIKRLRKLMLFCFLTWKL